MLTKHPTIAAILGSLYFSFCAGGAVADEITSKNGSTLYGKISSFDGNSIVFNQNCGQQGHTISWNNISEARLSGDCKAAKSWRGGGDPSCEDRNSMWIEGTGLVSLEVMPKVVTDLQTVLPFGTATELLSRGPDNVTYRDVCTGDIKSIPTGDLVLTPTDGYCKIECQ
ncbi:hypothetical protein ACFSUD_18865 [Sulfitobacter aestuarii]|uniref:Uncharacterized protein n=1 Tax=Sulfitobacter aestuarii TaxID=2161676 RepID=A0ABW5UA58_9RHOB